MSKIDSCDVTSREIIVERRAEGGVQVLKTRLPCLITMLEGSNEVRRGTIDDSLRAARAEIVTWSAKDADIADLTKCGLKGSPTIVKKVFAPTPRTERAALIEPAKTSSDTAEALIGAIFARRASLEEDMTKLASGF